MIVIKVMLHTLSMVVISVLLHDVSTEQNGIGSNKVMIW